MSTELAQRRTTSQTLLANLCEEFENDLAYFVGSFLIMNAFSGQFFCSKFDLQSMLEASPALRKAISAVSALHRSQTQPSTQIGGQKSHQSYTAMTAYSQSVCLTQCLISQGAFYGNPHDLWSTFLLGLFEVSLKHNLEAFVR